MAVLIASVVLPVCARLRTRAVFSDRLCAASSALVYMGLATLIYERSH